MEKTIHLVRHGEVQAPPGIFLGTTDTGLNQLGEQQSSWLAKQLAHVPLDHCFCSPLLRTQQTAATIMAKRNISIETETSLREINFGDWEGRTFTEVEATEPDQAQSWCDAPIEFAFPGGDAVSTFVERLQDYYEILKSTPADNLLLVTHGGVIRILLTMFLQLSPDRQFMFDVARGSLSTVKLYETTAILTRLNYGIE